MLDASMARGKRRALAPYRRRMTFPRPFAGWMTSVRLETLAASEGREFGRGQRYRRRTAIRGSAVSGTVGTGAIGKNCARGFPPLVGIWRPISSHKNARC